MGLYDVPMFMSLFGFGIGMMFASFHGCCCLVMCCLMRYASPSGPMCLRCLMLTLSGPVELLFCFVLLPLGLVLSWLSAILVFLSMCLFVLCVLCLTVLVNCLLNAFAICVGEVNVFSLKVMVLFLGCVG